jgi:hypothetical protein
MTKEKLNSKIRTVNSTVNDIHEFDFSTLRPHPGADAPGSSVPV